MVTRNPLRTAIREQANTSPRISVRAGGLCGPRRVLQPGFQSNGTSPRSTALRGRGLPCPPVVTHPAPGYPGKKES
ncbi:MAG: hypothetical protein U0232_20375 [Thermomicrobiales bacterium]